MAKDEKRDPAEAAPDPGLVDSSKVQIRRVGAEPLVELSYLPFYPPGSDSIPHSRTAAIWHPDPAVSVFEVSADIAKAAVASGHFEQTEASRVRLKGGER